MDITQARDFIQGKIIEKQKEIDAFNLALSILSNTFQVEFTSRDEAIKQAQQRSQQIDVLHTEKSGLETEKSALLTQKSSLETDNTALIEQNTILSNEKMALEVRVTDLELQLNPLI